MAEPLKNIYHKKFFEPIIRLFEKEVDHFDSSKFMNAIFCEDWNGMELKARYHHIALVFHDFLPKDFSAAITILLSQLQALKVGGYKVESYEYLFYPDYIESFGLEDWETSELAMKEMTKYISCEFAIRPFLKKNPKRTFEWLYELSTHSHENVRRFSSEACRPKLPWGGNMKALEVDPSPIFPIMETLITDESLFVKKSVANNLNDISKTHPNQVIAFCKRWKNGNPHSEWIIKHACRTMLKAGQADVMQLFNYANIDQYRIYSFALKNAEVTFGNQLEFEVSLQNQSDQKAMTRLEYGLYLLKANGQKNRKVFKISEFNLDAKSKYKVTKKHAFVELTTRKYYMGEHELSLIVNGIEIDKQTFTLNPQ